MELAKPPNRFLALKQVRRNTVIVGGWGLNLLAISDELDLDHGYLSKVMSGERPPTIVYAKQIAETLGWTLDDLIKAIDERRQAVV